MILLDFASEPGATSAGVPYVEAVDGKLFCPQCLTEAFGPEYGLAYGGIGAYWLCEHCDWFYKVFDREEA